MAAAERHVTDLGYRNLRWWLRLELVAGLYFHRVTRFFNSRQLRLDFHAEAQVPVAAIDAGMRQTALEKYAFLVD